METTQELQYGAITSPVANPPVVPHPFPKHHLFCSIVVSHPLPKHHLFCRPLDSTTRSLNVHLVRGLGPNQYGCTCNRNSKAKSVNVPGQGRLLVRLSQYTCGKDEICSISKQRGGVVGVLGLSQIVCWGFQPGNTKSSYLRDSRYGSAPHHWSVLAAGHAQGSDTGESLSLLHACLVLLKYC